MANIAVFLADGFEEVEAIAPIDILRRGGMNVITVSVMGTAHVVGSHGIRVQADEVFEGMDFDSVDMLVLPGGKKGTENLEAYEPLINKVKQFAEERKYLAAICAAPTILGHLGILEGKKATCYGGLEGELKGAETSEDPVVVDGRIITSRGMGTATQFGLKLLEIFTDEVTSKRMAASVMMP